LFGVTVQAPDAIDTLFTPEVLKGAVIRPEPVVAVFPLEPAERTSYMNW
jgi:hypothetical protein